MYVVATAGHVDHGKSTLVRALTGMEPDRWAEERRRGMTIDLGYAWTTLPSGAALAFVDVPGHERFLGNMLAGLGPAPAVMFVVAADEGWRRQSTEHLAAVDALGLRHGLLVVTRCDLADPAAVLADSTERLAESSLGVVEGVAVSGATGEGLADLESALDRLVARLPAPREGGRVRLWVDRAFTIRGSGTVVTGTLESGRIAVGDVLELHGQDGRSRRVTVRGLESLRRQESEVVAVARVAVNLRAVDTHGVSRGDALLTPGAWRPTRVFDVRLGGGDPQVRRLPAQLQLHAGTASCPARVRLLGGQIVRITVPSTLALQPGDHAILRDPARQVVAAGLEVLDVDPPQLRRRGAAVRRAADLVSASGHPDVVEQVVRRGAARRDDLAGVGVLPDATASVPATLRDIDGWLVSDPQWEGWCDELVRAVDDHAAADPVSPWLPVEAARRTVGIPTLSLAAKVAAEAGLSVSDGRVSRIGAQPSLGRAEQALADLETRWAASPFVAPEHDDLVAAGLGSRELAAATAAGRVLLLAGDVVLPSAAGALAMRELAALPQPFTVSAARQALGTTRRVAVPLLEHLDAKGWTVRVDGGLRHVAGRER